jgi:hypothetical protein
MTRNELEYMQSAHSQRPSSALFGGWWEKRRDSRLLDIRHHHSSELILLTTHISAGSLLVLTVPFTMEKTPSTFFTYVCKVWFDEHVDLRAQNYRNV